MEPAHVALLSNSTVASKLTPAFARRMSLRHPYATRGLWHSGCPGCWQVQMAGQAVTIVPDGGPSATVLGSPVQACSMVLHVIDTVLLPRLAAAR